MVGKVKLHGFIPVKSSQRGMTFLGIIIPLDLFDLSMISAQTRSASSRGKAGSHFSGSCSGSLRPAYMGS
jgi:hypothetical protein